MVEDDQIEFPSLLLPPEVISKMAFPNPVTQPLPRGFFDRFPFEERKAKVENGIFKFACSSHTFYRLRMPDNAALSAKSVSYFFSNIQWTAGRGWPVYSNRCPRGDKLLQDPFPFFKHHSLLLIFGGLTWGECDNSFIGQGNEITDVFVGPNDDQLGDNTGGFDLFISAFGQ